MVNHKQLAIIFASLSVILLVLYAICLFTPNYCEGAEEEYVGGLRIMEERPVATSIVPIDYPAINAVMSQYTTCPAGVDCAVDDIKFMDVYIPSNYTENDMLKLMTQIVDKMYDDMPFLYDRNLGFIFHDFDTLEEVDAIYVTSNRWSRKIN